MTIQLDLPSDVKSELEELGLLDDSGISTWVTEAIRERLSIQKQRAYLDARANRADRNAIREALAKVPAVEPAEEDRW